MQDSANVVVLIQYKGVSQFSKYSAFPNVGYETTLSMHQQYYKTHI